MFSEKAIETLEAINKHGQVFGFINGYMLGVVGALESINRTENVGQKSAAIIDERLPRLCARLYGLDAAQIETAMKAIQNGCFEISAGVT